MSSDTSNFVIIMAGGVGSRFWPASREHRPKQFLDITANGRSLLQMTYDRVIKIVPESHVLILSVDKYKDLILEQLEHVTENQLLLEPSRNNTGPCIAYAALHLRALHDSAVFAVVPADHIISREEDFVRHMLKAFHHAAHSDDIVTLGIRPSRPDTGYGYINYDQLNQHDGVYDVVSFKEKPDSLTAEAYVNSGKYLWNAGIFIWSASTLIEAFRLYAPDILSILTTDISKYGTLEESAYIAVVYPQTRKVSVDFAILEHAQNVKTIPVDIGWSDLGTWNSLYSFLKKENETNVVLADQVKLIDSKQCLIKTSQKDKLIIVKGLEDYIIIDEDDVLLIYPRHQEQQIKQLRQDIEDSRYL